MNTANVLVVAAHPDDEILGCGGTLARHVLNGDNVFILFLADGEGSRFHFSDNREKEYSDRESKARAAAAIIGAQDVFFQRFPDNRMDSVDLLDVVQVIESYIEKISPDIIYTHHSGDLNLDHRLTHQAVMTACRPQPNFCVSTILCFEVVSSTEWQSPTSNSAFIPNWFVDISRDINKKKKALNQYEKEMRQFPHPRSWDAVKSLAKWRGASVGVNAAEAFMLVRQILK